MYKQHFTVHPVGQGLFYSSDLSGVKLVYDCGSSEMNNYNFNKNNFENYIDYFKKTSLTIQSSSYSSTYKYEIDILVISHFDSDHVNGLAKLLKNTIVKNLFIPYSHGSHMIALLYLIKVILNNHYTKIQNLFLVLEDKERSLNTDINYEDLSEVNEEFLDLTGHRDITTNIREILKAGTIIKKYNLGKIILDKNNYLLDFYNLEIKKTESDCLDNKVLDSIYYKKMPLSQFIDQAKSSYSRCLGKSGGSLTKSDFSNNSSLCLAIVRTSSIYRLRNRKSIYQPIYSYSNLNMYINRNKFIRLINYRHQLPTTLLTGDINLRSMKRFSSFDNHYEYLHSNVDVLLSPHHGAQKNWNDKLQNYIIRNKTIVVSSSGLLNNYNHPSLQIEYKILKFKAVNIRVNEMNGLIY